MGFPKCHMVKYGNEIRELVVVPKANQWTLYRKAADFVTTNTADDYEGMKEAFNTEQSANAFMSIGSQSQGVFSSVEDVSEEDMKSYIKQITGK